MFLFIVFYLLLAHGKRDDPEAIFQRLYMVVNEKPSGLKGEGLLHRAKQLVYFEALNISQIGTLFDHISDILKGNGNKVAMVDVKCIVLVF